jgi:hypothetical protein
VPSGVWAPEEYDKLPPYDNPTAFQPMRPFYCHQQDDALCSGWVGCHDMEESLGLRMATVYEQITPEAYVEALDYVCPVPLFGSGVEAAAHGKAEVETPGVKARRTIDKLERKRARS